MDVQPTALATIPPAAWRPAALSGRAPRQLPPAGGRNNSAPARRESETDSGSSSGRLYPGWAAARAFMADLSYVARAYTASYAPAPAGTLVYLLV